MTWPVPCGMVQAPPNAVAGAPAMNASAAAAAPRRFGPAQIKNGFPNASYAVRQGLYGTANINTLRTRTAQMAPLAPKADWFRRPHLFARRSPARRGDTTLLEERRQGRAGDRRLRRTRRQAGPAGDGAGQAVGGGGFYNRIRS